jgi:hypothetical protein
MIVITIARKPLAESSIVENVAVWNTGGLNITSCRISTSGEKFHDAKSDPRNRRGEFLFDRVNTRNNPERFQQALAESIERTRTLGRWPANFILEHLPECICRGLKTVRDCSNASLVHTEEGRDIGVITLHGLKRRNGVYGHANADGTETVADWNCAPGCPVADLDRQSGVRKAGTAVRRYVGKSNVGMFAFGNQGPEADFGYGDVGTATRYFKQVQRSDDE